MCNEGIFDRVARIIVGILAIMYGLIEQNYLVGVIGFVPLVTGFMGICPLYSILKLNSGCSKE